MGKLVAGKGALSAIAPGMKHIRFHFTVYHWTTPCFAVILRSDDREETQDEKAHNNGMGLIRTFGPLFPLVLAEMPRIETLIVTTPEYCGDDTRGSTAPSFDLQVVASFRTCLASTLSNTPLEHLTDLRLTLPCAYDFVAVGAALSDTVCAQLRHLYLSYVDPTGPGGSAQYLWRYRREESDGFVPRSNLQQQYPNPDHMKAVCNIVDRCTFLESLGLAATHHLDCDLLNWTPTNRKGLRTLYLNRVRISHTTLIRLLSTSVAHLDITTPPNPACSVWLHAVELKSGTWNEIFDHLLLHCPLLYYLSPVNLCYARGTASNEYWIQNSHPHNINACVWSRNVPDEERLWDLVTKLVYNAGGEENYPRDHGETMVLD